MRPLMIERHELTGRTRGRPNRFGRKLTMQVEVQILTASAFQTMRTPPAPGCADLEGWDRQEAKRIADAWKPAHTIWRDATWADQLALLERHNVRANSTAEAADSADGA